MSAVQIVIAGFGGQGILFAGKFLAYKGLLEEQNVSWLPSYGPEMRGGTANCSVILSGSAIGSPIVTHPDVLMVMNLPSLDKFEDAVVPGGKIFVDSTLIGRKVKRTDVEVHYVPATQMATDAGIPTLANMLLTGKLMKEVPALCGGDWEAALKKVVSARHQELLAYNLKALQTGAAFEG